MGRSSKVIYVSEVSDGDGDGDVEAGPAKRFAHDEAPGTVHESAPQRFAKRKSTSRTARLRDAVDAFRGSRTKERRRTRQTESARASPASVFFFSRAGRRASQGRS
jgi:hypothetical protein